MKFKIENFQSLSLERLYQILEARQDVFTSEQGIICTDPDYKDQLSWHAYTLTDDDNISSYLRIIPPEVKYNEFAIGRVLTRKDYRNKGLSKLLMKEAMNFIASSNYDEKNIRLSAQSYLEDYYKSIGFEVVSEPYIEEGLLHTEMLYTYNHKH